VLAATNAAGQAISGPTEVTVRSDPLRLASVGVWGDEILGQCDVPPGLSDVRTIAAGNFHALAVQGDGYLGKAVAWGKNADAQTTLPASANGVIAVAAGGDHSLALRADGKVVGWGRNWDGQTNVPAGVTTVVAIAAGRAHSVALLWDGRVVAWGNNAHRQTTVPEAATNILRVAAGYYHTLALRADRTIVAWGSQYAAPVSATNVVDIAAGWEHSLALLADGTVVAWGDNSFGQTTVPVSATNVVAIAAGYGHSWALRADGVVLGWGTTNYGVREMPPGLRNVAGIAAGENHVLALVESGPPRFRRKPAATVAHVGGWAIFDCDLAGTGPLTMQWYRNGTPLPGATNRFLTLPGLVLGDAGEYVLIVTNGLGQASSAPATLTVLETPFIETLASHRTAPPQTPFTTSATVRGTPPMTYRWLLNGRPLADDGRISGTATSELAINSLEYADAGVYSLVVSNAAGSVTGLVTRLAVTPIIAWGDDAYGQLRVPIVASNVVAVSAGESHSLALLMDGTAVGWGDSTYGQAMVPPQGTNLVVVSAGGAHSLGLTASGEVLAWGDGSAGQTSVPQSATGVVAVAAGARHSLALLNDGRVVGWGDNTFGQTNIPAGTANVVAIAAGDSFSLALRADGTLVSWGSVISSNQIVQIAAGSGHRLVLRDPGDVMGWGRNYFGQATAPLGAFGALAVAAGGDHSLALGGSGQVLAWGGNYSGQTAVPAEAVSVVGVSAGGAHSLALDRAAGQFLGILARPSETMLGERFELRATSASIRGTSYQWQFNGQDIPGATNVLLVLPFVHWTNGGNYRVLGSNIFGTFASLAQALVVQRAPLKFDITPGAFGVTPDGLRLRVLGAAGLGPVVVSASSDLTTWMPVHTNPPVIGAFDLLDAGATNRPQTFYRAGELSGP
jgi:alpha-tubulin suppressor-like RCC1 family protein